MTFTQFLSSPEFARAVGGCIPILDRSGESHWPHLRPPRPPGAADHVVAASARNRRAAAAAHGLKDTPELDERGRPILSNGKLLLGDLGVRRDFGFAGDYAEVMHMVLQHPTADDYVVGTGEDHSIQEFCELAFQSVGLDWTNYVSVDPKLIRKTDSHYTRADPAKLWSLFNWRPKVTFPKLVSTMVEAQEWRLEGWLYRY
jgi:GDPmannose 4,6-dehydratase